MSGVLQRKFYEETGSGSYVWHAEDADEEWEDTRLAYARTTARLRI